MNIILRLFVSIGLIITALTVLDLSLTQGVLSKNEISAFLNRNFYTTCLILCMTYLSL